MDTLWKDRACVITFLRRFGWQMCRVYSKRLSTLKPQLDSHNVRMIAVGMEEIGVEDFVAGNYFHGGKAS